MISVQENKELAPLTTIGLGGLARYFVVCESVEDIQQAIALAKENSWKIHILGGGSNTIFSDEGFAGLVIAVRLRGITFADEIADVAAGEVWDEFVQQSIAKGLAGVECLSGIPGLVGATPMQNVGAYGQDVSEVVDQVRAINRQTGEIQHFSNNECEFAYRSSRFKEQEKDQHIITSVRFRLRADGAPTLRYPQLVDALKNSEGEASDSGTKALEATRQAVLRLRRSKSMVVDSNDPNTKSCGSFFVNPIIDKEHLATLQKIYPDIPFFTGEETPNLTVASDWTDHSVKVPAAWLVEKAGFSRGTKQGGVGISTNHPLALVNYGGTTQDLLTFAKQIEETIAKQFNVSLVREPVVIEPSGKVQ